jgi:hypothetical protein
VSKEGRNEKDEMGDLGVDNCTLPLIFLNGSEKTNFKKTCSKAKMCN